MRLVRQLLISSVAERNYSAQEVMHLLMGWPLYHASRTMIVLSLRDDWVRLHGPSNSILSQYARREDLIHISLFEFAKSYRLSNEQFVRRQKDVIVRLVPHIKLTEDQEENEEYYKLQCKLYVPWRGDFEQLKAPGQTWLDVYQINTMHIDLGEDFEVGEFALDPDEFESTPPEPDEVMRNADMAAARVHPGVNQQDPIGHRPIDEAHDWETLADSNVSWTQVDEFLRSYKSMPHSSNLRPSIISYSSMSEDQRRVIDLGREQVNNPDHCIKRVIVQGKAGTGKSEVIKSMRMMLDSAFPDLQAYQILAPTGAAANNIDGKTIHSFFRIPINGQMCPLNGEPLRLFQLQLQHLKFLMIDEYSMIGLRLMHKIYLRLCQARGSNNEVFGGYFVYLFGDLRQLPPVKDSPIYSEPKDDDSRMALNLINNFNKCITLSVCHRQSDDQVRFRTCLDRLATGTLTEQDWQLLMSRRSTILSDEERQAFIYSIRLFPNNERVESYNKLRLSDNQTAIARIEALNNNYTAKHCSSLHAGGLSQTIHLSIGSRIMLRKNIYVSIEVWLMERWVL